MLAKTIPLFALVCGIAHAQGDPARSGRQERDAWIHEFFGFRIERPSEAWAFAEGAEASGYKLSIRYERKPTIEASVRATSAAESDAGAVQQKAVEQVGGPGYSSLERVQQRIADRDAPGIGVHFAAKDGTTYRIEQLYLVEDGVRYVFQCHAPADEFANFAEAFAAIRGSLKLIPASGEAQAERRLTMLAARCGSEVDWAKSWNDAANRARDQRKLVLVVVRSYPGFNLPDQIRAGPLMNPDVIELLEERCVALWLTPGMAAPFRAQDSYGMSGSTFGQALLLVTPDGEVVHETQAMQSDAVYEFLRASTAAQPRYPGTPVSLKGGQLRRAERHLRRGELAAAERLLGDATTYRAQRLRASLFRRQRNGDAALAALRAARTGGGGDAIALALEEVWVLTRMGRDAEAKAALARVGDERIDAEQQAALLFWEGILAQRAGDADALRPWHRLTTEHPDSRWAWQAAAVMRATQIRPTVQIRTEWPDDAVLASLRDLESERRPLARLREIEKSALAFLLQGQRADGSWISPSEIVGPTDAPNPFTDAVTAICGRCVLRRRQDDACLEAAQRALGFVLESHRRAREIDAERSYMDYTVWSKAFMLWFFVDCLDQGVGEAKPLRAAAAELVADLRQKQKPGGGWSYYVTRDLGDGGGIPPQSISFVTAPVLMALLRARESGIPVPEPMTAAALDCLDSMRNDNGAFIYMWQPGADDAVRKTLKPGAAGRAPLCELALLRGGRGSIERLRGGLEMFRDHRRDLARQLGKVLMHAGPDGQGCHYLMFDYGFAAAAVRELPKDQRAEHRDWLLDLLLDARSAEGGFRGTQINGWAFGTAMALFTIWDLQATD